MALPPISCSATPNVHRARITALTQDILEDIFILLQPLDLARAATSCKSFNKIITDQCFVRRVRAANQPVLLGFVAADGFHGTNQPATSAAIARGVAVAADFTYSFIPKVRPVNKWCPLDGRGGRVLVQGMPAGSKLFEERIQLFISELELAVCDPLFRRYKLLPPVPNSLLPRDCQMLVLGLFLGPAIRDDHGTRFSVVCVAKSELTIIQLLFDSHTIRWHITSSFTNESFIEIDTTKMLSTCCDDDNNCFYWTIPCGDRFLVYDGMDREMSFIEIDLAQYRAENSGLPLICAGPTGPHVFILADFFGEGPTALIRVARTVYNESSKGWTFASTISLPSHIRFFTLASDVQNLFLNGFQEDNLSQSTTDDELEDNYVELTPQSPTISYYYMNLNTSELKRICLLKGFSKRLYPFYGFGAPFATPIV